WPGTPGNASALLPHGAPAHSLSFSPDGQWLSIALANGWMRVLRPGTWGEAFRDAAAPSAQFTADGRWLVAVGESVVRVYRPGDWERMPDLVHEAPVEGVWVSPDGTRLATRQEGSFSRGPGVTRPTRMRVWDAASGRLLGWRDEPEHDRARGWYRRDGYDASAPAEGGRADLAHQALQWPLVRSAPDSPRGGWNVVLRERTVALVDDGTGRPVAEIDPAHGNLRDAEVSPDGAWLATAGEDGTVRLWRIGGAREMIAEACARVPRNLTRAEWERLFPGRPYRRTCPALPDPPDLATPPDTTPRQAEG
ncbi:MAG TPA: WD40 repeat domain-containing protein, partial [Longimicrobium sp.]